MRPPRAEVTRLWLCALTPASSAAHGRRSVPTALLLSHAGCDRENPRILLRGWPGRGMGHDLCRWPSDRRVTRVPSRPGSNHRSAVMVDVGSVVDTQDLDPIIGVVDVVEDPVGAST